MQSKNGSNSKIKTILKKLLSAIEVEIYKIYTTSIKHFS